MTHHRLNVRVLVIWTLLLVTTSPLARAGAILDLQQFSPNTPFADGLVIPFAGDLDGFAQIDNYLDREIVFFDSNYVYPSRVFCLRQQYGCGMTGAINFSREIADLTFVVEQTGQLSNVRVTAFRGSDTVVTLAWNDIPFDGNNYPVGPTRLFDFTGYGPITSVLLNSANDHAFYGDFRFRGVNLPVPVPGSLALLVLAVAGSLARAAIVRLRSLSCA